MADYDALNLPQWEGSKLTPRTGVMPRMASNGAVRLRRMHQKKVDIQLFHGGLTLAEKDALVTFYDVNAVIPFTVTTAEDSITRTCVFAPKGYEITPKNGAYDVMVYMLEQ